MTGSDHNVVLTVTELPAARELRLVVAGELDIASAGVLTDAVARRRPLPGPLGLDLSAVSFVDARGLRALADVSRVSLVDSGRPAHIVAASPAVRLTLRLCGVAGQFGLDDPIMTDEGDTNSAHRCRWPDSGQ